MAEPLVDWYYEFPPITRAYATAVALITVLTHFGFISPLHLYFGYKHVFLRHQYWRLVTNFLYFGQLNFDFLFHMFFLTLEEESFANRPADFLYMLLFGGSIMLVVGAFFHLTFLGTPLTFMLVYIWSRKNPHVQMSFLGLFTFAAPYMPWVLLCFSLAIGGSVSVSDLFGIVVGHAYYFLAEIYPQMYGRTPLKTPSFLCYLLNQATRSEPLAQEADVPSDAHEE